MLASELVDGLMSDLGLGCHASSDVPEDEWMIWLQGFSMPRPPCPECGEPMIRRSGKYGEFWGCSGYPGCRYTEDIAA